MKVFLLGGMPGLRKSEVCKKLRDWLVREGKTVGIGHVGKELLEACKDRQQVGARKPLAALVGRECQDYIRSKWPLAYTKAFQAASASNPDIAIIIVNFEYYRSETFEFYSPVDLGAFCVKKPDGILTLIDDLYDVYYCLSRPHDVFDIQERQERKFKRSDVDLKNLRLLYKDAMSLTIEDLLRVLVWREKETEATANVARALDCKHSVLATKHPIETGVRLLLGEAAEELGLGASYPVYISHPITRPRKERALKNEWPPFVKHLSEIVQVLSEKTVENRRVVPIMPTAIDEYRIMIDGLHFLPHLTPRWPLEEPDKLLYVLPPGFKDYEEYERRARSLIFDPPLDTTGRRAEIPLADLELSGALKTLRESIRLQMAGRDHLLVRQCKGFLLYRPVYDELRFSGGVTAEIGNFTQLRKPDNMSGDAGERMIAFIHDTGDARGILGSLAKNALSNLYREMCALARKKSETQLPVFPEEKLGVEVLGHFDNPSAKAYELYQQMFCSSSGGAISDTISLFWETVETPLVDAIAITQLDLLSSGVETVHGAYTYSTSTAKPIWPNPPREAPDTYLDVVEHLDSNEEHRREAAIRVRAFFGRGVAIPETVS